MYNPQSTNLLTQRLQRARQRLNTGRTIPPRLDSNRLPLSFAQERFWLLDQFESGSTIYNRPILLQLQGEVSVDALQKSLNTIIDRHDTLRAIFPNNDGEPSQVIQADLDLPIDITDLTEQGQDIGDPLIQNWIDERLAQPFSLDQGPLLRVDLLRLAPNHHLLLLVAQHILFDAWSARLFIRELVQCYDAIVDNHRLALPDLPIQYADFAHWQREQFKRGKMRDELAHWQGRLAEATPYLELPLDHKRPDVITYTGGLHTRTFSPQLVAQLKELSQQANVTLFMTLLTAFKVLLHRYSGQTDIIVGSPVAGRTHTELEPLIGVLFNTLVLRTDLSEEPTFLTLLNRVRQTALEAYSHQTLPFEKLIEALNPSRDLNRSPIFQVMFNFENLADATPRSRYLTIDEVDVNPHTSLFEITIELIETPEGLKGLIFYQTELFEAITIERMSAHFEILLNGIVANPDQSISNLPMLTEAEHQQILVEWNQTEIEYTKEDVCFSQLFEAQVERTPDKIAVLFEEEALTYQQLNQRANRLARKLVEHGVGPSVVVALLDKRGINLLTAILAVFKAGGAYLPLDPDHPAERISQVLQQSQTPLVLIANDFEDTIADVMEIIPTKQPQALHLEAALAFEASNDNLPPRSKINDLAYVIFTSGSTGLPKGAMLEQKGMLNHLYALNADVALTAEDRVAQTATQCFDISVWQFLGVLLIGGQVKIYRDEITHDPPKLLAQVAQDQISVLELVPSVIRVMVEAIAMQSSTHFDLSALRWLISIGEALPPELARQWLTYYPAVPLLNAYGPTECSDTIAHYKIYQPPAPEMVNMPVGRPIGNMRLYILNSQLQPVPIGVPGELYVGGIGVGRGYLNDPTRTNQAFISNPFLSEAGSRLYKTGDLVRYLPDGNIEFLGRIDYQVKIRGFRIELGEIEANLSKHPAVERCVVIAREDIPGDQRLVAYIVPSSQPVPSVGEWRAYLKRTLPDYMIPAMFVTLASLPLTSNGKVNRRALPAPDALHSDRSDNFVSPDGPVEEMLAEIWQSVLRVDKVSLYDDFFELGGHSLLAVKMISRLHQVYNLDVSFRTIFDAPTIAQLAEIIEAMLLDEVSD